MQDRRSFNRRLSHTAGALALALLAPPSHANDAPRERTVLTVSGKIGAASGGDPVRLDMKALEALPQQSFTTHTPWFDRPVKFTGPLLADVLKMVKANGSQLNAVAINDYRISIPVSDTTQHKMLLARLIDDKPIPVREKGPLFVVYPFDSKSELRSSTYYERSIWQLKALEVR